MPTFFFWNVPLPLPASSSCGLPILYHTAFLQNDDALKVSDYL